MLAPVEAIPKAMESTLFHLGLIGPDGEVYVPVREFSDLLAKLRKAEKERIPSAEVAKILLRHFHFRTFADTDEVLIYKDGAYRPGGEKYIGTMVEYLMMYLGRDCTSHFVEQVVGHIRRSTQTLRSEADKDPCIVNLKNGLLYLDLEKGRHKLRPHTPDYFSVIQLPVKYDPKARCPKIKKFFRESVRKEDRVLLIEVVAFALFRPYVIKKAVVLYGSHDNGKSVYLRLLEHFFGKENCSHVSMQELANDRFAAADLEGKILNTCADLPVQAMRETNIFKLAVGGDTIRAQRKNQNAFTFRNTAKLLFSANQLPRTPDRSKAFFNRILLIDFPYTVPVKKQNLNLEYELATPEELSGLLNEALKVLPRLIKRKRFSRVETVEEIMERYEIRSDPVSAFVEERCILDAHAKAGKNEVYKAFLEYCQAKGFSPLSRREFNKLLADRFGLRETRILQENRSIRAWIGLELRTKSMLEPNPFEF